ncbi:hypothetical protein GF391_00395 [Candidatus Uhrbacteria bacterium]|nr:hypothetical protein [Candidatus Uhrbacteria bacterium]
MSTEVTVEVNLLKSYLKMIQNSIGSKMFRNLYATVDGKERDILEGGNLSCAFFVSVILHTFELIQIPHATVLGLLKDMEQSGWKKTRKLKTGDVVVWEDEDQTGDGVKHSHIGFYLGKDKAISNSTAKKSPIKHHFTFGTKAGKPKRKIIGTYRHEKLN